MNFFTRQAARYCTAVIIPGSEVILTDTPGAESYSTVNANENSGMGKTICFIGTGPMGSRMVERLAAIGMARELHADFSVPKRRLSCKKAPCGAFLQYRKLLFYRACVTFKARWALPQASLALFQAMTDKANAIADNINANVAKVLAADELTCASLTSLCMCRRSS